MCTLVTLYGCHDRFPLIVLANRDEKYGRPSTVPLLLHTDPMVVAPRDDISQGTWIGLTKRGFFAAITNQDTDEFDPTAKSRGQVVSEVLRLNDLFRAKDFLLSLRSEDYNPFNLVFGSVYQIAMARVHRGEPPTVWSVNSGVTVVSNDTAGTAYAVKGAQGLALAADIKDRDGLSELLRKALVILGNHANGDPDPHQALCVHANERGFGTRSTSALLIPRYEDRPRFFHSEGPTCQSHGFAEYSHLFEV